MDTSFVDRVLNPALDLDAKLSTHPIEVEIPHEGMVAQVRPTDPSTQNLADA
jgi:hypothetical protein